MKTPCKLLGPEWHWEEIDGGAAAAKLIRNGNWYVGVSSDKKRAYPFSSCIHVNGQPESGYYIREETPFKLEELKHIVEMLFATGVYK